MHELGPWCVVDGRLELTPDARIPAWDAGFMTAYGAYETMRVEPATTHGSARVVARAEHLARLSETLVALRLPSPPSLDDAIDRLLAASAAWCAETRALRLTVTPTSTTLFLRALQSARASGLHLHRVDGHRALPRYKTLAWFPVERLHPRGAEPDFEAVWLDGDDVLEGNRTNLFAVIDGVLRTAPSTAPILSGISRAHALAHARAAGLRVDERAFTWAELVSSDEAFATNATLPLAPIVAVEGAPKSEGPVARALRLVLLGGMPPRAH